MPTWSEFLAIAAAQGVRRKISRVSRVIDPQGNELPIQYLVKEGRPPLVHPQLRPRDRLTPTLLGHLCRRLDLDPSPFGLTLEQLPPHDWP
jgi:hypothetical protein